MSANQTSTVIGVAVCVVLAVTGVYCLFGTVRGEARKQVLQQQQSESFGPFDDANADMVGVPRKEKLPRLKLP